MKNDTDDSSPAASPDRPLVLYDGDCAFCRRRVGRLVRLMGGKVDVATLQSHSAGRAIPGEIKLRMPDGRQYGGAEAIARTLGLRRRWKPLVWVYFVPGVRQAADAAYRWVAANRHRLG